MLYDSCVCMELVYTCKCSSTPAAVQYIVCAVVSVSCAEEEAEGQKMVMQGIYSELHVFACDTIHVVCVSSCCSSVD